MESGFSDKVEYNAFTQKWSENAQLEKGDSLAGGYTSELWDFTRISVTQNDLRELKEIWSHWDGEMKQLFYHNYGDMSYLLDIKVDKSLFRAVAQFWNSAYSCFTFGNVDLTPTIEEYTTLLRCPKFQTDKIYSRIVNVPTFVKRLMNITGMSEQWVVARVQQKGDGKCIPWVSLRELILTHPDMKRRVDVFALSVYGLLVFPKALRHIEEAVTNLFDQLGKGITPVPAILAETFRSLNACRRAGEGRFIGCAQLLLVWFNSHFWKMEKVSYQPFLQNFSPLKEITATLRRDDISEERWMAILQNLQEEDIEWRAPWMVPGKILFRCGDYDWVPLLGIWGGIGYAPFLVSRQYRSRQFITATQGLAQSEFCYKGDNYKKKVREICNAWDRTYRMEGVAVNPMVTPGYNEWRKRRVNDNILRPNLEDARPIEEYLRVVPSELEIIRQDFEKKSSELEKKIEQLEEEKVYLKLDVDVQKSEAENLRKGKRKVEEDLASLKEYYKRYRASVKNAGLGKTSEQWRQEIQEEKAKTDQWKKRFHDTKAREVGLEKSLDDSQNEKEMLRARVAELEKVLHQHRSRNSVIELNASLSRIEDLKGKVEELESILQNCELRIKRLEANNGQLSEQLHRSQDQVRDRDYLMGEAIFQIREVAVYLQTLAVQADVLSAKYELVSE
ncbi:hypothetical protein CXB51_009250 [Gossypium anomalum]|uniref:DUF7745 domain-containing protein n=1 Tax=Gossypium anomalum TaxID=47600 RepID=A0A8J5ZHR3_9ROSI|nr:hypothetical protein CXB51_009250 [Gossypium anomalum]